MTDLPAVFPRTTRVRRMPRGSTIAVSYGTFATALVAGFVVGRAGPASMETLDPQLIVLLRFMAMMKLAGVLCAAALLHWRLTREPPPRFAVLYVGAVAAMTLAPGLIWGLSHIAVGALSFHVGLLVFLVTAWTDDAASAPAFLSPWRRVGARPTTMRSGTTPERHR